MSLASKETPQKKHFHRTIRWWAKRNEQAFALCKQKRADASLYICKMPQTLLYSDKVAPRNSQSSGDQTQGVHPSLFVAIYEESHESY